MSAGYTVNYSTELIVYRTIREIADKMVIVLDSLKFNKKTFLSLGRLILSDTVVSDKGVPQQYIDYYEKNNIKIKRKSKSESNIIKQSWKRLVYQHFQDYSGLQIFRYQNVVIILYFFTHFC